MELKGPERGKERPETPAGDSQSWVRYGMLYSTRGVPER